MPDSLVSETEAVRQQVRTGAQRQRLERVDLVIIAVAFLIRLAWMLSVPFDKAPDEWSHYSVPAFLLTNHRLPVIEDVVREPEFYAFGKTVGPHGLYSPIPYFPYLLASAATFRLPDRVNFLSQRLISCLMGAAAVFFALLIGRRVFSGTLQVAPALAVSFHPQLVFLSSYINTDVFTVLVTTVALYLCIRLVGWTPLLPRPWLVDLGAGCFLGILLLSKYNGFSVLPVVLLAAIHRYRRIDPELRIRLVKHYLTWCVIGIGLASWYYIRNYVRHQDIFGFVRELEYFEDSFSPYNSVADILFHSPFATATFSSFWAVFDYLSLPGHPDFLRIVSATTLAALCALLGHFAKLWRNRGTLIVTVVGWSAVFLVTIFFLAVYNSSISWSPQGRYLLVAVVPFHLLLFSAIRVALPKGLASSAARILVAFFVLYNLHCLLVVIRPTYAGGRIRFVSGDPSAPLGPLTANRVVQQRYKCNFDDLRAIEVLIGTYARFNQGYLIVSLKEADSGRIIVRDQVGVRSLGDNSWWLVPFSPEAHSKGKEYVIQLEATTLNPAAAITVWGARSGKKGAEEVASVAGEAQNLVLCFRTRSSHAHSPKEWLQSGILLW